ncbi:MAG: hypothetical protein AW12_02868 [Candidatus Accumulibacter sp. BA-94]|nr:MAG: hypothetical protein AW12_02868 [Candidatus Accumulibacter sp. BA-94]
MADGVLEQVLEDALDHADVGPHRRHCAGKAMFEAQATLIGCELELLQDVLHQFGQGKSFRLRADVVGLELGEFEQVTHQLTQSVAVFGGDIEVAARLVGR